MVTMLGTATVIKDEIEMRAATRRINRKYGAEDDAWSKNHLRAYQHRSTTHR